MAGQGRISAVWTGLAAAAVVLLSFGGASAVVHEVGGSIRPGWAIPSIGNGQNYTVWAASTLFNVGDELHFTYPAQLHNVQPLANAALFDACDFTSADKSLFQDNGNSTVVLKTPGNKWYVCTAGAGSHCNQGMKFKITVQGTVAAPAPSKSPNDSAAPSVLIRGSIATVVMATVLGLASLF